MTVLSRPFGVCIASALAIGSSGCGRDIRLGADDLPREAGSDASSDAGTDGELDAGADAGPDGAPTTLWRADFETGDLSEWTQDGLGGVYQVSATNLPLVTEEASHSGLNAAKVRIMPANSNLEVNYLFRQATESEAYYSVWFFIPQPYTAPIYWNLIHFEGSRTSDPNNRYSLWDVDLQSPAGVDGVLVPYVDDFSRNRMLHEATPMPVPIARWFHFEVLLRKATDTSGRFAVWQDGTLILDVTGVPTVANDWVRFSVGGASRDITPLPADIYLDEAAISLSRIGP